RRRGRSLQSRALLRQRARVLQARPVSFEWLPRARGAGHRARAGWLRRLAVVAPPAMAGARLEGAAAERGGVRRRLDASPDTRRLQLRVGTRPGPVGRTPGHRRRHLLLVLRGMGADALARAMAVLRGGAGRRRGPRDARAHRLPAPVPEPPDADAADGHRLAVLPQP